MHSREQQVAGWSVLSGVKFEEYSHNYNLMQTCAASLVLLRASEGASICEVRAACSTPVRRQESSWMYYTTIVIASIVVPIWKRMQVQQQTYVQNASRKVAFCSAIAYEAPSLR